MEILSIELESAEKEWRTQNTVVFSRKRSLTIRRTWLPLMVSFVVSYPCGKGITMP
jgi:hypothetical protein